MAQTTEKPYKIVYFKKLQDPDVPLSPNSADHKATISTIKVQNSKKAIFYKVFTPRIVFAVFVIIATIFPSYFTHASLLSKVGEILNPSPIAEASALKNLENSQTVALLEATPMIDPLNNTINNDIIIDSDTALVSEMGPLGTPADIEEAPATDEIILYVVKRGDTISSVAKMFELSPSTIRSANDLAVGATLKEDMVLIILPVDGVDYTVKKGDTLASISKKFNADIDEVGGFNGITKESTLAIGTQLIIPGGRFVEAPVAKKVVKTRVNLPANPDNSNQIPVDGYFIRPVVGCPITQGRHDKYAVDMGCPIGTPIYASASGEVILSKNGYNGGFGNLIIIKHPNGVQTFYAHQSKRAVEVGEQVTQGQVIGYVGSTGRSTGPHLHFEVRGAKNPWFGLPKGSTR